MTSAPSAASGKRRAKRCHDFQVLGGGVGTVHAPEHGVDAALERQVEMVSHPVARLRG